MCKAHVLIAAEKSFQMIGFKDFISMKITTEPRKDDVAVVAKKNLCLLWTVEKAQVTFSFLVSEN